MVPAVPVLAGVGGTTCVSGGCDAPLMRVGLTGGIGSGKSEVARILAGLGAVVIDYDALAREVVAAGTSGFAAVVEAFGREVVGADGELDRARLADVVFADDTRRQQLNEIVHPLVRDTAAAAAAAAGAEAVVVHEIPLLVENGLASAFEAVVVVLAEVDVRVRRLVARGMTEAAARARIAVQASDDERRAAATHLIVNDAGMGDLAEQVARVWNDLTGIVAGR